MKTLNINGKSYKLAEIQEIQADFVAWAKPLLPDPLDVIKERLKDFPPRERDVMIRDAMQSLRTPKSLNAPEIQGLLTTKEGSDKYLQLTYGRHNPDLTLEQIWDIHLEAVKTIGDNYMEKLT